MGLKFRKGKVECPPFLPPSALLSPLDSELSVRAALTPSQMSFVVCKCRFD